MVATCPNFPENWPIATFPRSTFLKIGQCSHFLRQFWPEFANWFIPSASETISSANNPVALANWRGKIPQFSELLADSLTHSANF